MALPFAKTNLIDFAGLIITDLTASVKRFFDLFYYDIYFIFFLFFC
jgi:hypothetical protein